jgi:hypothetical protein
MTADPFGGHFACFAVPGSLTNDCQIPHQAYTVAAEQLAVFLAPVVCNRKTPAQLRRWRSVDTSPFPLLEDPANLILYSL